MSESTSTANGTTTETTAAKKPPRAKKPAAKKSKKAAPKKTAKKSKKTAARVETKEYTPAQIKAFVAKYAKDWDISVKDAEVRLMTVVINRLNALARYNAKN